MVTRWNKNGNLIWTRSLRINSQFGDWALGVEELSNGEILIVGNINSSGYLASGLTLKLSASGEMIWGKMYRFFEGINFRTSLETPDGYLVAGEYLFNGNTTYRTVLIKINKLDGNLQWIKSYTSQGNIISSGPLVKTQNGYILNGINYQTASAVGGFYKHHIIYLNPDFTPQKSLDILPNRINGRLAETNLFVARMEVLQVLREEIIPEM